MQTLQTLIHGAVSFGQYRELHTRSFTPSDNHRDGSIVGHTRHFVISIMYRIEALPSTSSHVTPGWTYVPDRGFDPAQAAITPTIGRKRGIRDGGRTDLSSRQSNAIIRHLAELDRENHRDVHIPIPVKQKDAARGIASITRRFI
jgi:hypothetical protein